MLIYGKRRQIALEYSDKKHLHSERFLNYVLLKNSLTIKTIHFPFYRVRANGKVSGYDRRHAV